MESPTPTDPTPVKTGGARKGVIGGALLMIAAGGLFYRVWNMATPATVAPVVDTSAAERAELTAKLNKFFDEDARPQDPLQI